MFTRIVDTDDKGIYVSGAKAHQTGCINSHWIILMPTVRLTENDKEWAFVGVIPADAKGVTYIYGRQSCDTRSMEDGDIDDGNAKYAGQEALMILERVFIPWDKVFMNGEHEFAAMLIERFTCYHRRSYVCKTGLGDVLIGAAATIADYNGVPKVSHIKDKLIEMTHLNESIFAAGIASSHLGHKLKSGVYLNEDMLAQVCKHNVTRFPYEISRLAQDIAGGLVVTLPSEKDFRHPIAGPMLKKFLVGRKGVDVENRMRILRLIENMTLGRNSVGYLTESMHGAGSPQAQRIQIQRQMQIGYKKNLAKHLAGITNDIEEPSEHSEYFQRIFQTKDSVL
jgi:4-hydroxybutyryl-CoA dehydratase/vinylacetyl-CoA-Delta-isomerase